MLMPMVEGYRMMRRLGRGGMGTVYLAEQLGVANRFVAIKIINLEDAGGDEVFLKRFAREVELHGRLNHPNVVTLYETTSTLNGEPALVMEYVEGKTLEDIIAERPLRDWYYVTQIARQIVTALKYAHDREHIIHRDIKPSNVMVLANGDVKVLDFGIARRQDAVAVTIANQAIGSLPYMSPEQCNGRQDLTEQSDMYSFGCLLFEAIAGKTPFAQDTGTNPLVYLNMHRTAPPPLIGELVPTVPAPLARLIASLLRKEPVNRPASYQVILNELDEMERRNFKPPFFLKTFLASLPDLPKRVKSNSVTLGDLLLFDAVLPGISPLLIDRIWIGIPLLAFNAVVLLTPFPLTEAVVLRVLAMVLTLRLLRGRDWRGDLHEAWLYRQKAVVGVFLFLAVLLVGVAMTETYLYMDPGAAKRDREALASELIDTKPKVADQVAVIVDVIPAESRPSPTPEATPASTERDLLAPRIIPPRFTPAATPAAQDQGESTTVALAGIPTPEPTAPPLDARNLLALMQSSGTGRPESTSTQPTPVPVSRTRAAAVRDPASMSAEQTVEVTKSAASLDAREESAALLTHLSQDATTERDLTRLFCRVVLGYCLSRVDPTNANRISKAYKVYPDSDATLLLRQWNGPARGTLRQDLIVPMLLEMPPDYLIHFFKRLNLGEALQGYNNSAVLRARLQSSDSAQRYAALLVVRDLPLPDLTEAVANQLVLAQSNPSATRGVHDEALRWLERHGTPAMKPYLERALTQSQVSLGDQQRIKTLLRKTG